MVISSCCSDVSFWRSDRAFELASGRTQVGQVFFHQIFAAVGVGEGRDVEGGEDVSIAVAYRHRQRSQAGLEFLRSEEHTSELQSLMSISYAVYCMKKKKITKNE